MNFDMTYEKEVQKELDEMYKLGVCKKLDVNNFEEELEEGDEYGMSIREVADMIVSVSNI